MTGRYLHWAKNMKMSPFMKRRKRNFLDKNGNIRRLLMFQRGLRKPQARLIWFQKEEDILLPALAQSCKLKMRPTPKVSMLYSGTRYSKRSCWWQGIKHQAGSQDRVTDASWEQSPTSSSQDLWSHEHPDFWDGKMEPFLGILFWPDHDCFCRSHLISTWSPNTVSFHQCGGSALVLF